MKPSPHVVFQEIEGELVLLDLDREHYFSLDEVGARVWTLLGENGGNVDGAVAAMLEEYDVDEPTLRRDIDSLLADLQAAGLLEAL